MSRILRTLLVNTPGARVSVQKRALLVRQGEAWSRVPMESVDGVVVLGGGHITTDAVARCVAQGIRVAALTRGGKVRFVVAPEQSGNVHLRLAQYRVASDEHLSLRLARVVVAAKIANSRSMVRRWQWGAKDPELVERHRGFASSLDRKRLKSADADTEDSLRGIEGDAARLYFKAMRVHLGEIELATQMTARTRRPPLDPVNAALSFGYGLMTAELAGAAQAIGLDHQIGFLHAARSGRPSLALDVLEEFRSGIVDRFVVGAVCRKQLREEHFERLPGGAVYLNADGRAEYFRLFEAYRDGVVRHELLDKDIPRWSLALTQMTVLARHLRGDWDYVPWTCVP